MQGLEWSGQGVAAAPGTPGTPGPAWTTLDPAPQPFLFLIAWEGSGVDVRRGLLLRAYTLKKKIRPKLPAVEPKPHNAPKPPEP